MEFPKEYHYVYYSYEEWGRGYIGSRSCICLPEEDVEYFGSYTDVSFNPTKKIILNDNYFNREEANLDEIRLHNFYDVANNSHFANKAKATSTRFCVGIKCASENGKKGGPIGGKISYENKLGFHSFTKEQRREIGSKSGKIVGQNHKERRTGVCGFTKEEYSEYGRKGGEKCKEFSLGVCGLTFEQRSEIGKKGGQSCAENGKGIHALTSEQRSENGRRGAKKQKDLGVGIFSLECRNKAGKISCSQKWQCLETGFVTNPGNLTKYQKARGIDVAKRIRIS